MDVLGKVKDSVGERAVNALTVNDIKRVIKMRDVASTIKYYHTVAATHSGFKNTYDKVHDAGFLGFRFRV